MKHGETAPLTLGSAWQQKHPRFFACIVSFSIGSLVASSLALIISPPTWAAWAGISSVLALGAADVRDLLLFWLFLEKCAVAGAFISLFFYGPWCRAPDDHTRNQAVFRGAILGFLALPTTLWVNMLFALVSKTASKPTIHHGPITDTMTAIFGPIFISVFGSMLYFLAPELFGALAGYTIWRMVRMPLQR